MIFSLQDMIGTRGRTTWLDPDLRDYDSSRLWRRILRKDTARYRVGHKESNLLGSRVANSDVSRVERRHMPLIDLDYPHAYVPSSQDGHTHLYLDVEISHWRWVCLMIGLYLGRVISLGYLAHSLKRGQNFVRQPWIKKSEASDNAPF